MLSRLVETQESIQAPPFWMKPGISFENPREGVPATIVRDYPWLMIHWQTPLTTVRRGEPHNEFENKELKLRKPYWRREAKNGVMVRLNHSMREVPSFDELGFGQIPDQGKNIATHDRGTQGFLTSLLTQAGSMWQKIEQQKREAEVAKEEVRVQAELEKLRARQAVIPTNVAIIAGTALLGWWLISSA